MPSSWGRCGVTPEWATTGREPSAFCSARLTAASSTLRFHVGSCCSAVMRAAKASVLRRSHSVSSAPAFDTGSLCPHHTAIEGWWPSRSTIARAWRVASLRMVRAYAHCSGMSCHTSSPRSSARSYSSSRVTWAWTRTRSRPASHARSTSRRSSSGVASPRAMRVGARLVPLRKRRSPLTEAIQRRIRTERSPVRSRRSSLTAGARRRPAPRPPARRGARGRRGRAATTGRAGRS